MVIIMIMSCMTREGGRILKGWEVNFGLGECPLKIGIKINGRHHGFRKTSIVCLKFTYFEDLYKLPRAHCFQLKIPLYSLVLGGHLCFVYFHRFTLLLYYIIITFNLILPPN